MPDKPARPIEMMTWAETGKRYIHQTKFSLDHKQLERDWANRFVRLWNARNPAEHLAVDASLDFKEPADLWLINGAGQRIDLQIVEAVDAQRLAREGFKRYVQKALLDTDCDETRSLVSALSGTQIVLTEHTPFELLPKNTRQGRREVVSNVRAALWECVRAAPLMPGGIGNYEVSRWMNFQACEGMEMMLHSSRYASADLGRPFKFLWLIGDVVKDDPPRYFEAAIKKKLDLGYLRGENALWLLVYSVDCSMSLEEEGHILAMLNTRQDNPFSRILAADAGYPVQVYPHVDNTSKLTARMAASTALVSQFLPDLLDDRWIRLPVTSR